MDNQKLPSEKIVPDRILEKKWHEFLAKTLRNKEFICILLLVGFTMFSSLDNLERIPNALYYDEISAAYLPFLHLHASARAANFPLASIIVSLVSGQYFTYELTGSSAFWIRFPSAVYGILFVLVCWALVRKLHGSMTGLISGVLASTLPWAFYFRRWGAVILMAYAFYVTLSVYFSVKYFQEGKSRYKYGAYISMAVSFYTHAMAVFFNFLFFPILFVFGIRHKSNLNRKLLDVATLVAALTLAATPLLVVYVSSSSSGLTPGLTETFYERTSISQFGGIQFIENVLKTGIIHLSPDFLVLTGGELSGLSRENLYFYGSAGGQIGMLSVLGALIYVWFLWFLWHTMKKKDVKFATFLAAWWLVSYFVVSGLVYYGNPNAARNIVGLPAFVLIISLVVSGSYKRIAERVSKRKILASLKICLLASLILPAAYYISLYSNTYSTTRYVDIYCRDLGEHLTKKDYWNNTMFLGNNIPLIYVEELRFYSNSVGDNIIQGDIIDALRLLYSSGDISVVFFISTVAPEFGRSNNYTDLGYSESVYSSQPPHPIIFTVTKLTRTEIRKEPVLNDNGTSRWIAVHSELTGKMGDLRVFNDTLRVRNVTNSLGITVQGGDYDWAGVYHAFDEERKWESATAFSFWVFGTNSSVHFTVGITCKDGRFLYAFSDSFNGWKWFIIPFSVMNRENRSPSLSQVTGVAFYSWGSGVASIAVDDISLLK